MLEAVTGQRAASGRTHQQALAESKYGSITSSMVSRCSDNAAAKVSTPDRAAAVIVGNAAQVSTVHGVKAALIHIQAIERSIGGFRIHTEAAVDGSKIAHAPQQSSGNPWRAACAFGDFHARRQISRAKPNRPAPAADDMLQIIDAIKIRAASECRNVHATAW